MGDEKVHRTNFDNAVVWLIDGSRKRHSTDFDGEENYGFRKGQITELGKGTVRLSTVMENSTAFDRTVYDDKAKVWLSK